MREITRLMINEFKIMDLGYDFMGYKVNSENSLSFHHLIVPRRNCKKEGLGDGYLRWNGAILNGGVSSSHEYLHLVENYDYDRFLAITSELIDENIKGKIDIENLRMVNDILKGFEREKCSSTNSKGKRLIKEEYLKRVVK